MISDGARLSMQEALARYTGPVLLVHGTADESVPFSSMEALGGWAPQAETMPVEGAGHTLGAVHPFAGPTDHLEAVASRLARWYSAHLLAS